MHVHPSFISIMIHFVGVVVIGSVWRLVAMHLVSRPDGSKANKFGRAMAVQY